MESFPMVYVAWNRDKRRKHPLYVGSSERGIHRALNNQRLMARKADIGIIEFYRCARYSDALTLEGKLTRELKPELDLMYVEDLPSYFELARSAK